jgi:hypothetical protein
VPTIALHADDDRLIAFLMVAGGDSLQDGPVVRDCVILAVPTDAALLDQPLMAAIEPWLNDERYAHVVCNDGRASVHVKLGVEDELVLVVDLAGSGRWRLDPDEAAIGWCRLASL